MLIKHVMSSIPLHVIAALNPPLSILNGVERIFLDFFWGSEADSRNKRCGQAWFALTYLVEKNGLGLCSLKDICSAFSVKLWWKLHTSSGCWLHYVSSISFVNSFGYRRLQVVEYLMLSNVRVLVLDASSSFLHFNWMGSNAIIDLLDESLFALNSAWICDLYGKTGWDVNRLHASLPDHIVCQVVSYSFKFYGVPDWLIWVPSASGLFTVSLLTTSCD